jgi:hypothetical protein
MLDSPEMQSAWTQLWKTGHFESLPADRDAGRLASLDAAWTDFLTGFPAGAHLLDLATGGGDVIRRAVALDRNFRITGVDLADLSAVADTLKEHDVRLVGNTDLSDLPFPDAVFDGVMSQFGIEYADIAAATSEAVRVMVPGGRGHLVLHHAGGAITQGCINSVEVDRLVFADVDPFELGKAVFRFYQQGAPRETISDAEIAFRNAVSLMQSRLQNKPLFEPARRVVMFLSRLAAAPGGEPPAQALSQLADVEEQVQSRVLRKLAQLDAALDRDGIGKLTTALVSAGAAVDPPRELKYPAGKILAWDVSFKKSFQLA